MCDHFTHILDHHMDLILYYTDSFSKYLQEFTMPGLLLLQSLLTAVNSERDKRCLLKRLCEITSFKINSSQG